MTDNHTLRILVGADAGDEDSHAFTDVLSDDDGGSHGKSNGSRGGDGLENTDRCGGTLKDRGHNGSEEYAQERVFEHEEYFLECSGVL